MNAYKRINRCQKCGESPHKEGKEEVLFSFKGKMVCGDCLNDDYMPCYFANAASSMAMFEDCLLMPKAYGYIKTTVDVDRRNRYQKRLRLLDELNVKGNLNEER